MKRLLFLAVFLFLAAACSPAKVTQPKTAEDYLQEGERHFDNGQYQEAIASWEKVREAFYSPELNMLAELKIAEAHFLAKEYVEAAAAYEDFLKQHPDHERTPQVLFQLGMSYYNQILSADRDQTATRNALVTFETLLKRYPADPKKQEVQILTMQCRDRLAEHELLVGHFYLRTGAYAAAINRLKGIPSLYPDYANRDRVYFYLGQAYLQNGERQQAVAAFNTLFKDFPQSEYIKEAHKIAGKLD
ncbi:MAG TPA: outer membrane protein assembly factor BamD [Desulfuromonadales bacterium]|jgi:outer membrane protein assembly factor BamD